METDKEKKIYYNVFFLQIFPINVKGIAGSLVTVINWIGCWIISYFFNFLVDWITAEGEKRIII